MTFIWKKQLVMFVTMFFVVLLGLIVGGFLHDRFVVENDGPGAGSGAKSGVAGAPSAGQQGSPFGEARRGLEDDTSAPIQTPSLSFPTTKPGA